MTPTNPNVMMLDPTLSTLLEQLDPSVKASKDSHGKLYVKLKRALYGCVQSAKLWYDKLKAVLIADGFTPNDYDGCLFNKATDEGKQITVAFHVDDLLVTCQLDSAIDDLIRHLQDNFKEISVVRGSKHSYLAMNIEVDDQGIHLDMIGYIDKCLEGRITKKHVQSPATDDLFGTPEESKGLDEIEQKKFHSDVAKLLYLAKRTKPDILTAVSHLSSRVDCPTADDKQKLDRVFDYIASTRSDKLMFAAGAPVSMQAYIDASFGVHADGTSRTGVVLMMAGAVVGAWSGKQKLVTKSSTEAEIVGLSDGLSHALWARELLQGQGYAMPPTEIFQDNEGVLKIMGNGRHPRHRTKHLNVRHFFARDRVRSGDITLIHKPTKEMLADVMTKPVTGKLFKDLISRILGNARPCEE